MISVKILSSDENCETLMGHEKTKQKQNKQTIKQKTYKKKVIWVGMSTNLECEKVRNCSSWHDHLGLILKEGQSQ